MMRGKCSKSNQQLKFVFFFLFTFSFLSLSSSSVYALTCTWNAAADGALWSDPASWTGCGAVAPTSADAVVFDGTSTKTSTIDAGFVGTINSLSINAGYTGTITQSRSLVINTSYSQATGTFTGGSDSITITTTFTLSGGTFTSTTGTLQVSGGWTHTAGGTFTNNGGTVTFAGSSATIDVATTEAFTNLNVNKTSGQTLTITSGDTLTVSASGTLTLTDGAIGTGTIDVSGQVSIPGGATLFDGGTGTIRLLGSTSRTVTLVAPASYPSINVTSTATATTINLSGSGTASIPSSTGTLTVAAAGSAVDFSASSANFSATFVTQSNGTITTGSGTFAVPGTGSNSYTQSGGIFNGGTTSITTGLTAQFNGGTFNAPNTPGGMTSTGYTIAGGTFNGGTGNISLSNNLTLTSGTFNAPSANLSIGQNFTWTSGTLTTTASTNWSFTGSGVGLEGSISNNTGVSKNITVNNFTIAKTSSLGIRFSTGTTTFTVAGTTTLTSGYMYQSASGTVDAQGPVTINGFGVGGDGGDATLKFSTSTTRTITIPGGTALPKINIDSTATGTTINPSGTGTVTVAGFTMAAGVVDFTGFGVNFTVTGATTPFYSQSGGTFTAGTGTYTFASSFSLSNGTFTASSAASMSAAGITISGGTFTAPTGNLTCSSSFTHTVGGTFNHNSGTVLFTGSAATVNVGVSPSTSETFNNLTINKTNAQTLTITSGKTLIAIGTLTLTNGLVSTGTLEAQGAVTVGSGYDGGTSPLNFTGSAVTQTFTLTGATGLYDGDITINKSSGTVALASALVMDAANQDLAITSGTFSLAGNNLTVNGTSGTLSVASGGTFQLQGGETITLNAANPTLSAGSTVNYVGTVGPYTLKNYSYSNLTIAGGAASVFTLPGALTGIATTTLTSGILSLAGSNISMTTLSNDSTFRLQGGETVTITNGMDTDSGTVEYVGNGATSYSSLAAGNNYYALTFNNATGSWTHTSTLDINNHLTITAGTLVSGGQNITIAGNWSNAGTYTSGSNTVTFDGTGAQSLTTGGTGAGQSFNHLTVSKSGGTLSLVTNNLNLNGTLTASGGTFSPGALTTTAGTLTVNGGTFTGAGGSITISGTLTVSSGTLTASSGTTAVGGNFVHSGGTFNHNSGTVNLNGTDQTISGSSTFNNLTKSVSSAATLTFPASTTNTIAGTLTLSGTTNSHLSLASSSPGVQTSIDPQGTRSVQYLTVQDNNNINSTAITCSGCTNSGNNTNWTFAASTVTWDGGGGDNNWSTAANWTNDTVPGASDTATFNATSTKNAIINTAIDVAGISIATGYSGVITQAAAVTLESTGFTQSTGTFTGGSQSITITGSMNLSGGTFTSTSGTLSLTGDFINTGTTFTHNSGTVTFNGTGAQSLTTGGTGAGQTFNNLTVNKGGGTLSLATNHLNVAGILSISLGTFSPGALNSSAGDLTINGGTFTGGGGTVLATGTTTMSSGTFTQNTTSLTTANLVASGATFSGGSATIDVNGNFTLSAGTFTSTSGTMTISGNFDHSGGGTFNANSGTVLLDGSNQTILGATTFNHLSKTVTVADTLTLPASTTNTMAGTLTLTGISGNVLSLRSSANGIQTLINPQGSRTLQYLDVQDNNNLSSTALACTTGCVDSGNNTNWTFTSEVTVVANAGANQTIVTSRSTGLNGTQSTLNGVPDSSGTNLKYGWEITATSGSGGISQAGSLSNANTATPTYNAPANAQTVQITLTASNLAETVHSTSTVQISVLSTNNVSQTILSVDQVGVLNGYAVVENQTVNSQGQTTVSLTIGNAVILLPPDYSHYTFTITRDNHLIIGTPSVNNQTGEVFFFLLPVNQLSGMIDLSTSNPFSFVTAFGAETNNQFGKYLSAGDVDGDGKDEILVGAPSAGSNGIIYIYNSDYILTATLLGSSTYPITSILNAHYLTTIPSDILLGPNNPALNANLQFQPAIPSSSQISEGSMIGSDTGFRGETSLATRGVDGIAGVTPSFSIFLPLHSPETVPSTESQPTSENKSLSAAAESQSSTEADVTAVLYESAAFGDLNADGNSDLVLVSNSGVAYLYYGLQTVGTTLTTLQANVTLTGASTTDGFGRMTLIGDVTGDGVADLIIGAPEYENGRGAIYIIFGSASLPASINLSSGAQVMIIIGDSVGDKIGSDLNLADSDGNGVNEIYTPKANGQVVKIDLFGGPAATGGGCSLNPSSHSSISSSFFFLLSLLILSFIKQRKNLFLSPSMPNQVSNRNRNL